MGTKVVSTSSGRKRRSPRLPQVVVIEIAGNGPDGKVFVESTRTREISRYGASLTTRNPFPLGAPMAIRRPGAKPVRARVVSAIPDTEPGVSQVGVEFVEEQGYWDCEFPEAWDDPYPKTARSEVVAARPRLVALDDSLEAVLRKAETVRNQAESLLQECASQIEAARRQSAVALAAQLDALAARKSSLEEECAAQARAAVDSLRAQVESARATAAQATAGLEDRTATVQRQMEAALQAGQEEYEQFLAQAGQRAARMVEQLAAQMEARRAELAETEAQTVRWRQQTSGDLAHLRQELERIVGSARGEMRTAALAGIQEFRQQLPQLAAEASRFFTATLAEQKNAATQWIRQAMETARAGFAELESSRRAELTEHAQQALDKYKALLQGRLEDARKGSEAMAAALEARLERARNAFAELADSSDRKISALREEVSAAAQQAKSLLGETAVARRRELDEVAGRSRERLQHQAECLQAAVNEATARLDTRARQLQEAGETLDKGAKEKRAELETFFVSLMARYDHRKEALDRILDTLESARAAARAGLDSVRTSTEENQARLHKFTGEREAALKSKALELEKKLQEASVGLEAALQERAAASLQTLHQAFLAGVEQGVAQARLTFQGLLDSELKKGAARVSEHIAALERAAEVQSQALDAEAAAHAQRLESAGRTLLESAAAAEERLGQCAAAGEETVKRAVLAAVGAVEDRQAKALAAVGEMLGEIQQARALLAREVAEIDNQTRQRHQSLDTQFAALSAGLAEKRAALDSFYSYTDHSKAELGQLIAGLDRRVEETRSALHLLQRDLQNVLDRRCAALTEQMQQSLDHSLDACEQELNAMGEAAQGVFEARLRTLGEQAVAAAQKIMAAAAEACSANLERASENLRRQNEARAQELARQAEEATREQQRLHEQSAGAAAAVLNEQVQHMSRLAIDRVREAHEMLLREIPARVAGAELAFRQSLEKILEQAQQDAAAALRALSAQLMAQDELELRRRLYSVLQTQPSPPTNGETS